jgi:hypothetical protein
MRRLRSPDKEERNKGRGEKATSLQGEADSNEQEVCNTTLKLKVLDPGGGPRLLKWC